MVALLAVGSPDHASAQSQALVSNITEATSNNPSFLTNEFAQQFTTGSNRGGYTLTSIDLSMSFLMTNRAVFSVAVHASSGGQPGSKLAALTAPQAFATGTNTFTHAGLDLDPSTSYFVVIDVTSNGFGTAIDTTNSDDEDGAAGWSIANGGLFRTWNSTGAWTGTSAEARKIRINGVVKTAPPTEGELPLDDGKGNIQPSDPDRVPRNVTLSASGLVTWTLDEATERETSLPYSVEWIAATRPVADMKWGWGDDHIMGSDYVGIEEHTCYDAGICRVQIDDFDPEWHYLVHVNTAERAYWNLPPVVLRHTPPPPPGAPSVTISGGPAVTEGTAATFTVSAEPAPAADLAVTVNISDAEGADFVKRRNEGFRTVTVPAGRTRATFEVPTRNDRKAEPGGDITAALVAGSDYALGSAASAAVAVSDDDGGSAPVPVEPPGEGTAAAFIVYHDPDAGAAAVNRYDTAVGLLDAASASYVVRTVTGAGEVDRLAGVSGSVLPRFFLGDPAAEGWGPSEPGVNNGGLKWLRSALADLPGLSVADIRVTEAQGAALGFTVTLSKAATGTVTVNYATADGTATAGEDYTATSGTLTFAPGETAKTVSVPVLDDAYDEGAETLTLTLSNAAGAYIADAQATGTIVNTDPLPVPSPVQAAYTVYHDPNAGAAAVSRYETAVGLLGAAGQSYMVRTVSGTGTVDRLAGVSGSVMPRFFLGDPEAEGWGPAQAKVNNGGLKWLRTVLEQSQASPAPAETVSVSVADASARESSGSIAFAVTLSAAAREAVSVDYRTRDVTAVSVMDYEAASGTLTFAPGETSKTVTVKLWDDAHDEGTETFSLVLSNPSPAGTATLADGSATGTITNADPLQKDWLARFGRAAASDAIAAVTARLEVPRDAGSHLTVGGRRIALDGSGGEPALPPPTPAGGPGGASWPIWSGDPAGSRERTMSARELLLGTSFRAVLGQGAGSQFTSWGQGASVSQFSSTGSALNLSGEAATGAMGMDYERGRLLTGFAMTHSVGEGTAQGAGRSYAMGSSVTTMLPYARLKLSERLSAWGLAGTGRGSLSLELDGGAAERYGTDLSMTLAATGVRGELVTPAEADGFALALKADAFWVRTESDSVSAPGVGNLAGARAEASRLRAVLDGSRRFALAGGGTLTPSATLGLRHDGGDAETGTGVEFGAGLGYADPSRGLDVALRVHGLAAHAEDGYSEWGVSGSIRLVPGGAGRGLSMSLTPSYGAEPGSRDRLWRLSDASGLAANDNAPLSSRLDAEVGYGIAMFGGGFTGTPYVGLGFGGETRDYRLGWRLASGRWQSFSLGVEAARREAANPGSGSGAGSPEHRIGLEAGLRW